MALRACAGQLRTTTSCKGGYTQFVFDALKVQDCILF